MIDRSASMNALETVDADGKPLDPPQRALRLQRRRQRRGCASFLGGGWFSKGASDVMIVLRSPRRDEGAVHRFDRRARDGDRRNRADRRGDEARRGARTGAGVRHEPEPERRARRGERSGSRAAADARTLFRRPSRRHRHLRAARRRRHRLPPRSARLPSNIGRCDGERRPGRPIRQTRSRSSRRS
jgi:hypothetical protein